MGLKVSCRSCETENSKFHCVKCCSQIVSKRKLLFENRQKHLQFACSELSTLLKNTKINDTYHQLAKDQALRDSKINRIKKDIDNLKSILSKKKQSNRARFALSKIIQKDRSSLRDEYRYKQVDVVNKSIQQRRKFVQILVEIFRLRRVQRAFDQNLDLNGGVSVPEYRIVNVGFSCLGNLLDYSRDKFNAAISYIVSMTFFLSCYLDVRLPFTFDTSTPNSHPLYLTDNNIEDFIIGISMMNFNICYLCHTQGVPLSMRQSIFSLENLAKCCQAIELGCDQYGQTAVDKSGFMIEFNKLLMLQSMLREFSVYGTEPVYDRLEILIRGMDIKCEIKDEEDWQFVS